MRSASRRAGRPLHRGARPRARRAAARGDERRGRSAARRLLAGDGRAAGAGGGAALPGGAPRRHRDRRPAGPPLRGDGAVGSVALAVAIFSYGPPYLRQALSAMFSWSSVEAASPYRIELTPGDAHGAARLRPDDQGDALGVRCRRRRRCSCARTASSVVRADAAGARRRRHVRDDDLRRRRQGRVPGRGHRREVEGLHARGRRPALRAEAHARVPLPGLHRPRAAHRRGRRRHRGAGRHRGQGHGDADDADAGRRAGCVDEQKVAARRRRKAACSPAPSPRSKDGFYHVALQAPAGPCSPPRRST